MQRSPRAAGSDHAGTVAPMSASSWLTISPRLRDALGPEVVTQLSRLDPREAHTCRVCGRVKRAGFLEPMSAVAAARDDGTVVVGLAHRECHAKVGDIHLGLLDDSGIDAQAFFGIRPQPFPRAVMAYEPATGLRQHLPGSERRDLFVAGMLASGFSLLAAPLPDAEADLASGWSLTAAEGDLVLGHPEHGVGYTQELTAEVREWLALARRDGHVLAVTGSGLGLSAGGPAPTDFPAARRQGLLVAATVAVR